MRDERERDALVRDGRTVVVISCSIHSTEVVGSQMAVQLAYELAAAGSRDGGDVEETILLSSRRPTRT